MQKIDAHQHFWRFDAVRDSWITDDMKVIQQHFLPQHLEPLLKQHGFDGCVVVQSDQSEAENEFQLSNAHHHTFIKGVVGWIDLTSANVEARLKHYKNFKKLKGFRHVLQGEAQRDFMLKPAFMRGIGLLSKYGFTYDILVFPDQLQFIKELVLQFPDQRFVIDHLAKPPIKTGHIKDWQRDMRAIAQSENVYCKVSGMITEADWKHWKASDMKPYMDVVVEAFGTDKIMFGSDWPVSLVAGSYKEVVGICEDYFSTFSKDEQDKFFGLNAIDFYKL